MATRKQEILIERTKKYCQQLGVNAIPTLIWTKKEIKTMSRREVGSRHGKWTLGFCPFRSNFIYIAYAKHGSLSELDKTLRHELIHFRFPKISHGKNFELQIKNLKNGQIWPPWDRNAFVKAQWINLAEWSFRRMFG